MRTKKKFSGTLRQLPNFRLISGGKISDEFLQRSFADFHSAAAYIWRLPYGRNADRADFSLVLKEMRGTCSTKHALLAALAAEQKQPVFLTLGIYELNAENTDGIGEVLERYDLKSLPEAHCFLTFQTKRIDVTRFPRETATEKPIERFLYEERIRPDQIGDYKIVLHQKFFRKWMREKKLFKKFGFAELWRVREQCIHALVEN